jgi:hypothetical protein
VSETNQEQPQPMSMSQPTERGLSSGPFKGDKIYVIGDLVAFFASLGISLAQMPAVVNEALKKAADSPNGGKAPDAAMIETFIMAFTGCVFVMIFAISIFLWMNIWKGKKWAFIVSIVLLVLGLGMSGMGLSGAGALGAIFGLGVGLVKLVYCILRTIGKVGSPLR